METSFLAHYQTTAQSTHENKKNIKGGINSALSIPLDIAAVVTLMH